MIKKSAGILLYHQAAGEWKFLLVHPGGPFWAKKDAGAWSIPKGEFDDTEDALAAARREFEEELGVPVAADNVKELAPIKQKSGKTVYAFAIEGRIDAETIKSNTFLIEWPPKSGKKIEIPEIDRAGWFTYDEARQKINPAQVALLDELVAML